MKFFYKKILFTNGGKLVRNTQLKRILEIFINY